MVKLIDGLLYLMDVSGEIGNDISVLHLCILIWLINKLRGYGASFDENKKSPVKTV